MSFCFCIKYLNISFPDGYDTTHMMLSGKFSYKRSNQRVLAFDTEIKALEPHQTQFTGSSSENFFSFIVYFVKQGSAIVVGAFNRPHLLQDDY